MGFWDWAGRVADTVVEAVSGAADAIGDFLTAEHDLAQPFVDIRKETQSVIIQDPKIDPASGAVFGVWEDASAVIAEINQGTSSVAQKASAAADAYVQADRTHNPFKKELTIKQADGLLKGALETAALVVGKTEPLEVPAKILPPLIKRVVPVLEAKHAADTKEALAAFPDKPADLDPKLMGIWDDIQGAASAGDKVAMLAALTALMSLKGITAAMIIVLLKPLVIIIAGVISTAIFIEFIFEEACQSYGMATYIAIDNGNWDVAKESNEDHKKLLDFIDQYVRPVGWLSGPAWKSFEAFYDSQRTATANYDTTIERQSRPGPKPEPGDFGEAVKDVEAGKDPAAHLPTPALPQWAVDDLWAFKTNLKTRSELVNSMIFLGDPAAARDAFNSFKEEVDRFRKWIEDNKATLEASLLYDSKLVVLATHDAELKAFVLRMAYLPTPGARIMATCNVPAYFLLNGIPQNTWKTILLEIEFDADVAEMPVTVTARAPDYVDSTEEITIINGEIKPAVFELVKVPIDPPLPKHPDVTVEEAAAGNGVLKVECEPPASVWLGGLDTDKLTPYREAIPPGTYTVTLEATGYKSKAYTAYVRAGDLASISAKLEELPEPEGPITTAYVSIYTIPMSAYVFIDGVVQPYPAPVGVDLKEGTHDIIIRKKGYEDAYDALEVVAGMTLKRTYDLKEKVAEKPGEIEVITDPTGADVFINGELHTWKTNTVIGGLTPGEYRVSVKLSGYTEVAELLTVKAGERAAFAHELAELPTEELSDLSVVTDPRGADIFINGMLHPYRTNTVVQNLKAGRYRVRVSKKGYEDIEAEFDLLAGVTARFEEGLTPLPEMPAPKVWRVHVTSMPPGCKILVNGEFTGNWTPGYVDLFDGTWEIGIYKSGYYPGAKEIVLGEM